MLINLYLNPKKSQLLLSVQRPKVTTTPVIMMAEHPHLTNSITIVRRKITTCRTLSQAKSVARVEARNLRAVVTETKIKTIKMSKTKTTRSAR